MRRRSTAASWNRPDAPSLAERSADDTTMPRAPSSCVVCRFVADSVERRIFFVLAEAFGERWFIARMRAGGFCSAHVRRLVAAGHGHRLTGPFEDVLRGWLARRREAGGRVLPLVGEACPICDTASWAEDHGLGLLAAGDERRIEVGLGGPGPLCLPHLDRLVDRVPWTEQVAVATRWAARLLEVVSAVSAVSAAAEVGADAAAPAALDILAGPVLDPPNADRDPATEGASVGPAASTAGRTGPTGSPAAEAQSGWSGGLLTEAGLLGELERGSCPVCTAVAAAPRRLLTWLADPRRRANDRRDLDALCGRHLRVLVHVAPPAGAAAIRTALERRLAMLAALPTDADRPPVRIVERPAWAWRRTRRRNPEDRRAPVSERLSAIWRSLRTPGDVVAERLRRARLAADRECVACVAAATARRRTFALLAATLLSRPGRERFERSDGLCLRHAALASAEPAVGAASFALVAGVAEGRVAAVLFELEEALRKSSWSVRYEPVGPEATAWRRAARLVLGAAAVSEIDDPFAAAEADEPRRPRRAI